MRKSVRNKEVETRTHLQFNHAAVRGLVVSRRRRTHGGRRENDVELLALLGDLTVHRVALTRTRSGAVLSGVLDGVSMILLAQNVDIRVVEPWPLPGVGRCHARLPCFRRPRCGGSHQGDSVGQRMPSKRRCQSILPTGRHSRRRHAREVHTVLRDLAPGVPGMPSWQQTRKGRQVFLTRTRHLMIIIQRWLEMDSTTVAKPKPHQRFANRKERQPPTCHRAQCPRNMHEPRTHLKLR